MVQGGNLLNWVKCWTIFIIQAVSLNFTITVKNNQKTYENNHMSQIYDEGRRSQSGPNVSISYVRKYPGRMMV